MVGGVGGSGRTLVERVVIHIFVFEHITVGILGGSLCLQLVVGRVGSSGGRPVVRILSIARCVGSATMCYAFSFRTLGCSIRSLGRPCHSDYYLVHQSDPCVYT